MKKLQTELKNGKIDILTTLHKPNSPIHKEVAFYDASYGSSEIQNALSLYYTKLVKTNIISMQKLIELTVKNPAQALKIQNDGKLKIGDTFNAVVFNQNIKHKINNKQSLFYNEEIIGKVEKFITGEKILTF